MQLFLLLLVDVAGSLELTLNIHVFLHELLYELGLFLQLLVEVDKLLFEKLLGLGFAAVLFGLGDG